ncbi:MAG: CHAD domain-containing protein [Candidatus Competibacter sp.]|nr:CHAD domain-containing protein [Candidatus Competibacter sp.]MDG4583483.1 CHAD domain-containing protein [Candidatus Competibacter sp.]
MNAEKRSRPANAQAVTHAKASPVVLTADTASEEAFIAIVGACLRHAEANRPAVLDAQVEGVHQMRVAFRRLRSGLKIFRPLIPREASAELVAGIRWLNGFLGPARDWDVFLEEGMSPVFARFPRKRGLRLFRARAEALRRSHYRSLRAALNEPHYPLLLQQFAGWLEQRAWRENLADSQRERLEESVLEFATPLLETDHRRVLKRGDDFARLSAEERHALRIRIKELRYAQDFFASLYPTASVKLYLGALANLQDGLGVMNDIAVTQRLLDEARLTTVSAARQVIDGWYGCRLDIHECRFAESWRCFVECERPWKN